MTNSGNCPECDVVVALADGTEVSEIITCSDCGSELEVRVLDPVSLTVAPQEDEDWGE